jgi:hypothetical protein
MVAFTLPLAALDPTAIRNQPKSFLFRKAS